MRNKKLLSTVVASALVATTMAMPVMAADGGSVDVEVTTKTGVLRVKVPTTLAVAVDQFEIGNTGAQIASDDFEMVNLSEMDVKVGITSTVTLGTDISLASGKDTTKGDEAWLAVAAMTGADSYDISDTAGVTEKAWDLTEANENVTTFGASMSAEQTFYLAKSAGSAEYKMAVAGADGKVSQQAYAQFYKLTDIATQPVDDPTLQAEVDKADVYYVETTSIGDEAVLKKIPKGTANVAGGTDKWVTGTTYYTAAETATSTDTMDSTTANAKYVYAAMNADGGAAGFTYVGKLSKDRETWTADDIKKINIAYTLTGVTGTNYDAVKNDCTYGYYRPADAAPSISTTTYTYTPGTAVEVPVNLGVGTLAATGVTSVSFNNSGAVTSLPSTRWSYSNGKVIFNGDYCGLLNNATRVHTITFNDAAKTTVNVTLQP